ncbi:peptidoglycan-binding domain-containing protein [Streptomyces hilarionis]|uniref:peptidoglycan-binding domain-containing protein n=1 Tax=Streptomyces hilarionis TaxID=2839954 RepID=UPI002119C8C7|nr:peptidoglycan-binding domain-containing protein [Streptomyces hilarionis]MCQ9132147.1 peptidoglycan-binding protein [Streptomyces hilarionis]
MSQPPRGVCPLCGAPRAADGAPGCVCARLASDAHRSDRTAQAAAAEDFDPVRIRPFVVLGDDLDPPGDAAHEAPARTPSAPEAPPRATPEAHSGARPDVPVGDPPSDARRPGRRRVRLLVLAGLLATAVTAAVLAVFLVYHGPVRDGSSAKGVRAPVPVETSESVTTAGRPSAQASRARPSATASRSTSPSASAPAPATPSRSAEPSPTPSADATGTAAPAPGPTQSAPPVLRLGDTGPEVAELQTRLSRIGSYDGRADGVYSRQVQAAVGTYQLTRGILRDESGVYGAATRASLEAETAEP